VRDIIEARPRSTDDAAYFCIIYSLISKTYQLRMIYTVAPYRTSRYAVSHITRSVSIYPV